MRHLKKKIKHTKIKNSISITSDRSSDSITETSDKPILNKSYQLKSKLPPLSGNHKKISINQQSLKFNLDHRGFSTGDESITDSERDKLFDKSGKKSSDYLDDFIDEENETYEQHLEKIIKQNKRSFTPLTDSIWPNEILNTRTHDPKNDIYHKIGFKFGSNLSEDGKYAMLKTYEDMLYYELMSINKDKNLNNNLERTKTEFFKNLPRKEHLKLPEINTKLGKKENTRESLMSDVNKNKYSCSKQLEKAMKIYDGIKIFKGEHTTNQKYYKKNQLLAAFKSWNSTCYFNI